MNNPSLIKVKLPELGEGVIEATITEYLVKVGDEIEEDQPIVEVSTDKVDTEINSPYAGIVSEILHDKDKVVKVGEAILMLSKTSDSTEKNTENIPTEILENILPKEIIHSNGNGHASVEKIEEEKEEIVTTNERPKVEETILENLEEKNTAFLDNSSNYGISFLSPLVKSICKVEKIEEEELQSIKGSGKEGRITKNDLLQYLENRSISSLPKAASINAEKQTEAVNINLLEERIEMSRTRKMISQRMLGSVQTSPHVTSFLETDMTNIAKWRDKNKDAFLQENGFKITFLPIIIKAVADTILEYPLVNISTEGETIIKKNYINIGIATALDSGELIVPVIKNADKLTVVELGKEINALVQKARMGLLKPTDVAGGTYTVSNIGTFGNLFGTPIINQPQSAILAVGSIEKKPAVIETEHGDLIGIRHKMFLSHTYDHRVIDGFLGGSFLKSLSNRLENFTGI